MNRDCCWYVYEKDTNFDYCRHPDHEGEEEYECEGCRDYYTKEDAKAEWRYKEVK